MTTINVTAEDIKLGKQGLGDRCPVALALKRAYGVKHVSAGHHGITLFIGEGRLPKYVSYNTPSNVTERMRKYDAEGVMEPFTFELPSI